MKSPGQRDFSAQEIIHHLMSLKLGSSSFHVVPVSLNGSRRISRSSSDGELIPTNSLLDIYATREKHAGSRNNKDGGDALIRLQNKLKS